MDQSKQMEAVFKSSRNEVDPVSGNEVPAGALPEEVRDDVPAMLSEGEYVVPADVLRYYGVKFFEDLRNEAKMGLTEMDAGGRIGGEPVEGGDDLPFSDEELMAIDDGEEATPGFAEGGLNIPDFKTPSYVKAPDMSMFGFDAGTSAPTGGVEFRTYVNSNGMEITIPFFNGEPLGAIPAGYSVKGAASSEDTSKTEEVKIEPEGRDGNVSKDRDTTSISDMDATQLSDAYSGRMSKGAKTALGVVGALTGLPVGLIGLADKMSTKSMESRAKELGIDLSTVTKGEDLTRENFVSDDAFNSAMDSVAPPNMSYDAESGSYTNTGSLAPTTSARPQARPGTGSTSSSSSSGKGLGQGIANSLGFDSFADMFDGGGKGASASSNSDSDSDSDNSDDAPNGTR